MSDDAERPYLDPTIAELLLSDPDHPSITWANSSADVEGRALANALSWARAPAMDHELVGEDAAVAAFRTAVAAQAARYEQNSQGAGAAIRTIHIPRWRREARRWRLALVASSAAALAIAASIGLVLVDKPPSTAGPNAPTVALVTTAAQPAPALPGEAAPAPTTTNPPTTVAPTISADPTLTALCSEYLATTTKKRSKLLKKAAFAPLIAAAGGTTRVDAFCTSLVGPPPTPTSKVKAK
jgi:hypothetical protein